MIAKFDFFFINSVSIRTYETVPVLLPGIPSDGRERGEIILYIRLIRCRGSVRFRLDSFVSVREELSIHHNVGRLHRHALRRHDINDPRTPIPPFKTFFVLVCGILPLMIVPFHPTRWYMCGTSVLGFCYKHYR